MNHDDFQAAKRFSTDNADNTLELFASNTRSPGP